MMLQKLQQLSSLKQIFLQDLCKTFKHYLKLIHLFAWQDIKRRYRRSFIGPFWLTLSTGIRIATIALVFGNIFQTSMDDYLPFVTIGIVFFGFINATLHENCNSFLSSNSMIQQLDIPSFVFIMKTIWHNIVIFVHNAVIIAFVLIWFNKSANVMHFLFGFLLCTIILTFIGTSIAIVCTRYRDMSQIVDSIFGVLFYLTPIMWMPDLLGNQRVSSIILDFNPFYHLIEIVRQPLLGLHASSISYVVSFFMLIVSFLISAVLYNKYRYRIVYWL